jgi:hypothetical protein
MLFFIEKQGEFIFSPPKFRLANNMYQIADFLIRLQLWLKKIISNKAKHPTFGD